MFLVGERNHRRNSSNELGVIERFRLGRLASRLDGLSDGKFPPDSPFPSRHAEAVVDRSELGTQVTLTRKPHPDTVERTVITFSPAECTQLSHVSATRDTEVNGALRDHQEYNAAAVPSENTLSLHALSATLHEVHRLQYHA